MNIHNLARTTPASRAVIAARVEAAASRQGGRRRSSASTARRYGSGTVGSSRRAPAGLHDRSSRPHTSPTALDADWTGRRRCALRRLKFTQAQIAKVLQLSKSRMQRSWPPADWANSAHSSRRCRKTGTSERAPASWCTSTPRSSAVFTSPGHRVTGDRASTRHSRDTTAGSFCTSRSTTGRAWHTQSSSPTRKARRCAGFLTSRSALLLSPRNPRIERVMSDNGAAYISADFRDGRRGPATRSTSERGPTRHAPTAKPSASSRRCCGSGPTSGPTTRRTSAPRALAHGFASCRERGRRENRRRWRTACGRSRTGSRRSGPPSGAGRRRRSRCGPRRAAGSAPVSLRRFASANFSGAPGDADDVQILALRARQQDRDQPPVVRDRGLARLIAGEHHLPARRLRARAAREHVDGHPAHLVPRRAEARVEGVRAVRGGAARRRRARRRQRQRRRGGQDGRPRQRPRTARHGG